MRACQTISPSGSGWILANRTILHAAPPRSECRARSARPWAEPSSRFTALFEALAIEWLKAASQKAVAGLLRLSWDFTASWSER